MTDVIISPDHYLYTESGEYVWTPARAKAAWKTAYQALDRALQNPTVTKVVMLVGVPASGKSTWLKSHRQAGAVYMDATFTSKWARKPIIDKTKAAGKQVEAVVMDVPINVCLERNACRPEGRMVPEDTLIDMAVKLTQEPPTTAEGIDYVEHVRSEQALKLAERVAEPLRRPRSRNELERQSKAFNQSESFGRGIHPPEPKLRLLHRVRVGVLGSLSVEAIGQRPIRGGLRR